MLNNLSKLESWTAELVVEGVEFDDRTVGIAAQQLQPDWPQGLHRISSFTRGPSPPEVIKEVTESGFSIVVVGGAVVVTVVVVIGGFVFIVCCVALLSLLVLSAGVVLS